MYCLAFLPSSVPLAIASRSIFPVEMAGMESLLTSSSACVPFPAPGAPSRMRFILPYLLCLVQEALVVPHKHLCLQSLHRLQSNAHDDDDGGSADGQVLDTLHQVASHDRQQRATMPRYTSTKDKTILLMTFWMKSAVGLPGRKAGMKPPFFLQVVGNLHRIILNGGIEPAEEEDHEEVNQRISPAGRSSRRGCTTSRWSCR